MTTTAQSRRRLVIGLWVGEVGPRAAAAETEQLTVSAVAVAAPQGLFRAVPVPLAAGATRVGAIATLTREMELAEREP